MPTAPKYRTDSQDCSCPGYWYRRTCKHFRAYREAVALVLAQDSANLAWGTARGGNAAVRGSQCDTFKRDAPTPAKLATVGQPPTPAMFASIG